MATSNAPTAAAITQPELQDRIDKPYRERIARGAQRSQKATGRFQTGSEMTAKPRVHAERPERQGSIAQRVTSEACDLPGYYLG